MLDLQTLTHTLKLDFKPAAGLMGLPWPGVVAGCDNAKIPEITGIAFKHSSFYSVNFFEFFDFIAKNPKPKTGKNAERIPDFLCPRRDGFAGGTFQDLISWDTDFSQFNDTLKKISQDKLWQQVQKRLGETTTRKRAKSEHDGEWSYDNRFDIKPFYRRTQSKQVTRIVRLYAESGFSFDVSTKTINAYGAFVAAVINMLEKHGVMVDFYIRYTSKNFIEPARSNPPQSFLFIEMKVKSSDEYLPPQKILKAISSNWYRRAGFCSIVLAAEAINKTATIGLGPPWQYGKPWARHNNNLYIYSVPDYTEQHRITESLLELVGNI